MRIRFAQHVPFETPGAIAQWAEKRGHEQGVTRFFAGEELPPPDAWDWLVIMGGPMGVHDETEYPWLAGEKKAIAEAIGKRKTVLGICLGAQLIAEALGARVVPNEQKEIGWFPVHWTQSCREMPLFRSFPAEMTVFHWHGETFDLPAGAERLAFSAACRNQAFAYGPSVFGFQFHLEMLEDNIRSITENCAGEIREAPYVQPAERMLRDAPRYVGQAVGMLEDFLDRLERQSNRHGVPGAG